MVDWATARILARFQPQAWIDDHAVDIDGAYEFDVTEHVLALGRERALALEDNREETDRLWLDHPIRAERPHDGPFQVSVAAAVRAYFHAEDALHADIDQAHAAWEHACEKLAALQHDKAVRRILASYPEAAVVKLRGFFDEMTDFRVAIDRIDGPDGAVLYDADHDTPGDLSLAEDALSLMGSLEGVDNYLIPVTLELAPAALTADPVAEATP